MSGLLLLGSGFQTPAKPASDWLDKKLAGGRLLQNPYNEH